MAVTYQKDGRVSRRGSSHFAEVLVLRRLLDELDKRSDQTTRILCNAVVPDGQGSREVDLIVVGPYGATAIEVKYFNDPINFVGQSQTLRCPYGQPPAPCKPEPRDQARRSMSCLRSLLSQSVGRGADRVQIAVNGMLLFANERMAMTGDPGPLVPVRLLSQGISEVISGELARNHYAENWTRRLTTDEIERVVAAIQGAPISEPVRAIDRYELLEKLGAGDSLEFRARCTLPSAPQHEEFRLRGHVLGPLETPQERERVWRLVWREYEALKTLAKKGVPGIPFPHDPFFDPDDDTVAWTVSEHIIGTTLLQRLEQSALPRGRVLSSVARTLAAAHSGGVIHRHLTPDCLWIAAADDSSWVLRWDIARLADRTTIASQIGSRLSKDSRYIGPEVRQRADRVLPASDIYSLGVITLELLHGAVLLTDDPAEAQAIARRLRRDSFSQAQCQKLLLASVDADPTKRGDLTVLAKAMEAL